MMLIAILRFSHQLPSVWEGLWEGFREDKWEEAMTGAGSSPFERRKNPLVNYQASFTFSPLTRMDARF